ncbi:MAG: Fe2+-dependent dioxygenase, partial [Alphaproteobacteria bacterium]|nr:Fe2+-dependent dioxygenase [Alphaproteobacteria bacterium]
MLLTFANVLSPEQLKSVVESLKSEDFVDGRKTAGWHAKLVKNNLQMQSGEERTKALQKTCHDAILACSEFHRAYKPKFVRLPMISRYEVGMSYGAHVDDPFMGSNPIMRTDVATTLFLVDPSTYEGGELVIEGTYGSRSVKLEAGAMVAYPATTLHRVVPVTSGARVAAVTWAQSMIPDPSHREIIFELDNARRMIFEKDGKSPAFDLVSKSHANLMR